MSREMVIGFIANRSFNISKAECELGYKAKPFEQTLFFKKPPISEQFAISIYESTELKGESLLKNL